MTYSKLSELAVGNRNYILKVRITRIWDSINPFADNNQIMSVDFLAVDQQGTCIQGTMRLEDSIHIKRVLLEGHVYELANFCVIPARRTFRAVFCDRFIQLTHTTKINELIEPIDSIPTYVFNCLEYSELPRRAYNDEYLTDVIGVLKKIGRIGTAYIREKPTDKRNLIIQNESGALLRATIWGNHAKEVNHNEMLAKTGPIVLILSAMTVRHFRGEICVNSSSAFRCYTDLPIPQVEDFMNKLLPGQYNVELLPEEPQPIKPEEEMKQNRKTIQELLNLDSLQSQDRRFTCEAIVKEINCGQGWWYSACPICFHGVQTEEGKATCNNHGPLNQLPVPWYKMDVIVEDATATTNFMIFGRLAQQLAQVPAAVLATQAGSNRYVLPNELENLIGRRYIFQIALNSRKGQSRYLNFKVTKVFDPQEDKAPIQTFKEHNLQIRSLAEDQGTSGIEIIKKDATSSNEDILHTHIPSQIEQDLFASEESLLSTPPGFVTIPTIPKQDATSSKKRTVQSELLPDRPSKKGS